MKGAIQIKIIIIIIIIIILHEVHNGKIIQFTLNMCTATEQIKNNNKNNN